MANKTLVKTKIVLEDDGRTMTTYVWEKWFWIFGMWIPHGNITGNYKLGEDRVGIVNKDAVSKVLYENFIHPKKKDLMEEYEQALENLYAHFDFEEDWVVYPIDDCTDCFWETKGNMVKYAETQEKFFSEGDYYVDDIYTQRFYSKWVYKGEKYTMIFCDPHVDGMKWFRIFDNSKEQK